MRSAYVCSYYSTSVVALVNLCDEFRGLVQHPARLELGFRLRVRVRIRARVRVIELGLRLGRLRLGLVGRGPPRLYVCCAAHFALCEVGASEHPIGVIDGVPGLVVARCCDCCVRSEP